MASLPTTFDELARRGLRVVRARFRSARKWARWNIAGGYDNVPTALFVVGGFGKSGRSTICGILDRDLRTKFFRETSSITGGGGHRLRLKPLAEIRARFAACRAPLIVVETKAESQNTPEILASIPRSKALWMYRHYLEAVDANLKCWHGQVRHLHPLAHGDHDDWRSQGASARTRDVVRQFYSPAMSRADACALFWYARNVLFFERRLESNRNVMLCNYEDLCRHPASVMKGVYAFIGLAYPGDEILGDVNRRHVRSGAAVALGRDIDRLCRSLMERLDECRHQQNANRHANIGSR